ncbi:MAG: hypothetical protein ACOYJJ_01725 [Anaerovoracaceae bacterium]|jgi:hypothetical protein
MKSIIRKSTYRAIYRLLDRVSPVPYDCGILCGSACCIPEDGASDSDDFDMGIYLLPGEEKVHDKKDPWLIWTKERAEDYEFPDSWRGPVYFVRCRSAADCRRPLRPIQCRTFPALPHLTEDGRLYLIKNDLELPYSCPLLEGGTELLDPRFLRATWTCWKHLIRDPLIRDLVRMDSEGRTELRILYPAGQDEIE